MMGHFLGLTDCIFRQKSHPSFITAAVVAERKEKQMQGAASEHAQCLRQMNRYTWSSIRREGDSLQTAARGCCCDSELYRYNNCNGSIQTYNAQKWQKTHKPHLRLCRPHSACEMLTFMTVQLEKVWYGLFREHFFSAERTRA